MGQELPSLSTFRHSVRPPSAEHLIVITYNDMLIPGVDYFVEGDEIRFQVAPRARSGADDSQFTQITYLVGYADQTIVTADAVPYQDYQGKKEYPLRVNTQPYTPTSAIGLIIKKNNRQLEAYTDYTVFENQVIFRFLWVLLITFIFALSSILHLSLDLEHLQLFLLMQMVKLTA